MADGRWQMAEGKKDFSRKGGYQGGFGIAVAKAIRTKLNTETKTRQAFPFCIKALCPLPFAISSLEHRSSIGSK